MKKFKLFSCIAASCAIGFAACNSGSEGSSATVDSSGNSMASTNRYAARADSFRTNTAAGYYLNPRTGKAYKSLTLDTSTGALTDETNQPVRRYVDNRSWRVYDAGSGDPIGSSRMDKDVLMYEKQGQWMPYDKMWADDSSSTNSGNMNNGTNNGNMSNGSNGNMNTGDDQMDTSGNSSGSGSGGSGGKTKVKIKTPEGKIKMDENGTKVKPR
jgi:hypothetical protein